MAFWEIADRKLLKIHGTINNYGSIVATEQDYIVSKSELDKNMIGSILKLLMATKTVVYIGYSARDEDFLFIYDFVKSEMKQFGRHSYVVTPDGSAEPLERFKELGIEPIIDDGVSFARKIKGHLQHEVGLIEDEMYNDVASLLAEAHLAHDQLYNKFNIFDNPEVIVCACYQDCLMHGLQGILTLRNTEKYSFRTCLVSTYDAYENLRKERLREKNTTMWRISTGI